MITYIRFALLEFKKNSRFNLIIAFEIAILLVVVVVTVSSVRSQLKYYLPMKDILDSKGCVAQIVYSASRYDEEDAIYYEEDIKNKYPCVDSILSMSHTTLSVADAEKYVNAYVYDDMLVEGCKPIMKNGKWLTEAKQEDGVLNVVVTELNDFGFKTGDEYQIQSDDGSIITARVVGEILDGAAVLSRYGKDLELTEIDSYFAAYYYDEDKGDLGFGIVSESEMDKYGLDYTLSTGVSFITVKDSSTDEELQTLMDGINNSGRCVEMSTVNSNSIRTVKKSLLFMAPIMIGVLLFVVITNICLSSINAKKQLRSYGVYYICGSRWKQCVFISVFSSIVTAAIAAVLAALALFIGDKAGLLKNTVIEFGSWQLLACLAVVVLYLITAIIMPLAIIGRTNPREILKNNE
ncbi:MAG: hypothetical protein LUH08_07205 [Ruminococcus sp.]|nr:hypothetical protein [Ruminococcus sp.]